MSVPSNEQARAWQMPAYGGLAIDNLVRRRAGGDSDERASPSRRLWLIKEKTTPRRQNQASSVWSDKGPTPIKPHAPPPSPEPKRPQQVLSITQALSQASTKTRAMPSNASLSPPDWRMHAPLLPVKQIMQGHGRQLSESGAKRSRGPPAAKLLASTWTPECSRDSFFSFFLASPHLISACIGQWPRRVLRDPCFWNASDTADRTSRARERKKIKKSQTKPASSRCTP